MSKLKAVPLYLLRWHWTKTSFFLRQYFVLSSSSAEFAKHYIFDPFSDGDPSGTTRGHEIWSCSLLWASEQDFNTLRPYFASVTSTKQPLFYEQREQLYALTKYLIQIMIFPWTHSQNLSHICVIHCSLKKDVTLPSQTITAFFQHATTFIWHIFRRLLLRLRNLTCNRNYMFTK